MTSAAKSHPRDSIGAPSDARRMRSEAPRALWLHPLTISGAIDQTQARNRLQSSGHVCWSAWRLDRRPYLYDLMHMHPPYEKLLRLCSLGAGQSKQETTTTLSAHFHAIFSAEQSAANLQSHFCATNERSCGLKSQQVKSAGDLLCVLFVRQ